MLMDAAMLFSNAQVLTVTAVSTNVFDAGVARDLGNGDDPTLDVIAQVAVAFAGGTSLQAVLQGSTDNSTFYTLADQAVVPLAALTVGQRVFDGTISRPLQGGATPAQATPRYYRMNYVIVGTMSGGSAITAFVVLDRQTAMYYAPGLVIAN